MIRDRFIKPDPYVAKRELVKTWSNEYTPDINKLAKYEHQLLFVCDQMMSDRRQFFVIEPYVVHKITVFTALYHDLLVAPDGTVLPFRRDAETGYRIKGELLQLREPEKAIAMLDKLKQRGVQFTRHRNAFIDPYRPYRVLVNGGDTEHPNDTFFADGRVMPVPLQGKKLWLGDEQLHTQQAWMYIPTDHWTYQVRRRPEVFHRVPLFEPKKDKTWLTSYYKFQTE